MSMKRNGTEGQEAVKVLPAEAKKARNKTNASLCTAVKNRDAQRIQELLKDDANAWQSDSNGFLPLYYAIDADDKDLVVAILTRMGPRATQVFEQALTIACARGLRAITEVLLTSMPHDAAVTLDATLFGTFKPIKKIAASRGFFSLACTRNALLLPLLAKHKIPIADPTEFEALMRTSALRDDVLLEIIHYQPSLLTDAIVWLAYMVNRGRILEEAIRIGQNLDSLLFAAARKQDLPLIIRIRDRYADKKQADRLIFAGALTSAENGKKNPQYETKLALIRETLGRQLVAIDEPLLLPICISPIDGPGHYHIDHTGGLHEGITPLGYVATRGCPELATILLDEFKAGADVFTKLSNDGALVTPFMQAVLTCQTDVATILLQKGADMNSVIYTMPGQISLRGQAVFVIYERLNERWSDSLRFLFNCGVALPHPSVMFMSSYAGPHSDDRLRIELAIKEMVIAENARRIESLATTCKAGDCAALQKMIDLGWLGQLTDHSEENFGYKTALKNVLEGGHAGVLKMVIQTLPTRLSPLVYNSLFTSELFLDGAQLLFRNNNQECCETLVEAFGFRAIGWCIEAGNHIMLDAIFKKFRAALTPAQLKMYIKTVPSAQVPLTIAINLGRVNCVRTLLENGFPTHLVDNEGLTALDRALIHRDAIFSRRTVDLDNISIVDFDTISKAQAIVKLLSAAHECFEATLDAVRHRRETLADDTNYNCQDTQRRSLLMRTILAGDLAATRFLLTKGIQFSKIDKHGHTALTHAVLTGNKEWIELLLNDCPYYKTVFQSLGHTVKTALILAAEKGFTDVLNCLVEALASDLLKKEARRIAFIPAVQSNRKLIVKNLVAQGVQATCYTTGSQGWVPGRGYMLKRTRQSQLLAR